MKIEKNKLVNRSQVLNRDIQLGIIAYSVAELAMIYEQAKQKSATEDVSEDMANAIEYIKSAKEYCTENNLDWNVCILLSHTDLNKLLKQ